MSSVRQTPRYFRSGLSPAAVATWCWIAARFCNCTEECNCTLTASEAEADFSRTGRALGSNNRLLKIKRCEAQLDSHASLNRPR